LAMRALRSRSKYWLLLLSSNLTITFVSCAVGRVVEEGVAPGDLWPFSAGFGAKREHSVALADEADDLVDGHVLQYSLKVLLEG
jgi:hypothetical protein